MIHKPRASLVAQLVKNLHAMWEIWVPSLGWEDPLEKGKGTHCSILAWRILQSMAESVTTDQSSFTFTRSWERGTEQILAQSSEGTNSTDPLITDVQPQELSENKLLLFKLCSCGTFIQQLHETDRLPI